jgi:hypothetical protein
MATRTARDVITYAFWDLGVVADQEALSDTQANSGFRKLNDLMAGFESEGIRYAHTDLATLDSTVNVPDGQLRNLGLMLQRELADQYGVALSPENQDAIRNAKTALQSYYYVPITSAPELSLRPRRFGRFNFSQG